MIKEKFWNLMLFSKEILKQNFMCITSLFIFVLGICKDPSVRDFLWPFLYFLASKIRLSREYSNVRECWLNACFYMQVKVFSAKSIDTCSRYSYILNCSLLISSFVEIIISTINCGKLINKLVSSALSFALYHLLFQLGIIPEYYPNNYLLLASYACVLVTQIIIYYYHNADKDALGFHNILIQALNKVGIGIIIRKNQEILFANETAYGMLKIQQNDAKGLLEALQKENLLTFSQSKEEGKDISWDFSSSSSGNLGILKEGRKKNRLFGMTFHFID